MSVFCCRFCCGSVVGGRNHLFEGGDAQFDLHQTGLPKVAHAFSPGLLSRAHGGVLYVDEVNLLHDHLVDVLLDAAAMGRVHIERDGVSHSHDARFVLIGTMNPEEGELRPQLLDRFGLAVEVRTPQGVESAWLAPGGEVLLAAGAIGSPQLLQAICTASIHGRCGECPSNSCQPAMARSCSSSLPPITSIVPQAWHSKIGSASPQ